MFKVATADLWDSHGEALHCVDPIFRVFGKKKSFFGPISTIRCFEDNSFVRTQLSTPGLGHVLVIDGGASLKCALVGDQLAALAIENGWAGLIINGCIRDSTVINQMDIGIRALNTCPVKSIKRNQGESDLPVKFASTIFEPGDYLYTDEDGILVSKELLDLQTRE
ncbi:MAG: ribonuclease E activity regulator RraA [Reichenbachiella sp.]|uniref:ribonuclease E activity regulator RraA n=1 Tax=Reichenbachiella sp. TaxID=2184521 RepID=UPI003265F524